MRTKPLEKMEAGRVKTGQMSSPAGEDYGAFEVIGPTGATLRIISSGTDHEFGWEHVSVSTGHRTPNWNEMCFVKDQFWGEDETVFQFHPRSDQYVNNHPNCLHMWRPMREEIPMPPTILVGVMNRNPTTPT